MPDVVKRLADRLVDTGWPGDRESVIRYTKAVLADIEAAGLVVVDPAEITELRRKLKAASDALVDRDNEIFDQERELREMERDLDQCERDRAREHARAEGYY